MSQTTTIKAKTVEGERADAEPYIGQMDIVVDLMNLCVKHGFKTLETRQMNAIIDAANLLIEELRKPRVPAQPGEGIDKWLQSDDVGQSSLFMLHVLGNVGASYIHLAGHKLREDDESPPHPHDPSDLWRCIKLLQSVPQLVPELPRMANYSPHWRVLVEHWDELTQLFEQERAGRDEWSAPKTYNRMQELFGAPHIQS